MRGKVRLIFALILSGIAFWTPFLLSTLYQHFVSPWWATFASLGLFTFFLNFRNGTPDPLRFGWIWEIGIWVVGPYLVLTALCLYNGQTPLNRAEIGIPQIATLILGCPIVAALWLFGSAPFRLPAAVIACLIPLISLSDSLSRGHGRLGKLRHAPNLIGLILWSGAYIYAHWAVDLTAHWAFTGSSKDLKETVIVPTLDTPTPEGKNIIWCSSFQLTWNELRNQVVGEPVKISGAQEIADRLNRAKETETDLPPDSYYIASGWAFEGKVEQIQNQMAKKFPKVALPKFIPAPGEFVLFSYLTARVRFTLPYFPNDDHFAFRSSSGKEISVVCFGIRASDESDKKELRRQVGVLYSRTRHDDPDEIIEDDAQEWVLDLCKDSEPNQIVAACVPFKQTLGGTLDYVSSLIAKLQPSDFHVNDVMLVPEIGMKVQHEYDEIEGKGRSFLNKDFLTAHIAKAVQMIDFRLDRSGAALESTTFVFVSAAPRRFIFDHPFLIYMKKREAERPFFVMWVDNAELMTHDEKK